MFIPLPRQRLLGELVREDQDDPLSGGEGVGYSVYRMATTLLGLPLMVSRARVVAYSLAGKPFEPIWPLAPTLDGRPPGTGSAPIPVVLWTPAMKDQADRLLAETGSAWKCNWFLPSVFLLLLGWAIWGILSGNNKQALEENQAALMAAPEVGDIVIAKVSPFRSGPDYVTCFRITRVDDTTYTALQSTHRAPVQPVFYPKERRDLSKKILPACENYPTESERYYHRPSYTKRSMPALPPPQLSGDERGAYEKENLATVGSQQVIWVIRPTEKQGLQR